MSTATVDVIELAREGSEMKHKNAAMSIRQTGLEAVLVKIRAGVRPMRSQIAAPEDLIKKR